MLEIIPLGRLQIDINQLLTIGRKAYGRNLTAQLDHKKVSIQKAASYLTILAEMLGPVDHFSIQQNPGNLLDHLFYSFLVVCEKETIIEILEQTRLATHTTESEVGLRVSVISGTMREWRDAIIVASSPNSKKYVRTFANKCMDYFKDEGFSRLWADYNVKLNRDSTYLLIEKE